MSLPKCWKKLIQQQQQQDYFIALIDAIAQQRAQGIEIYPKDQDIYNAFKYVDLDKIKVVILGQDPYHGVDQARGLAFSVSQNDKIPPLFSQYIQRITSRYRWLCNSAARRPEQLGRAGSAAVKYSADRTEG